MNLAAVTKFIRREIADLDHTERSYFVGQILWVMSLVISMTLLPLLVKDLTGNTADTGYVRAVYYWTLSFGSLFSGEIVRTFSMRRLLIGSVLLRGLVFAVIATFLLQGLLSFESLLILVGINALFIAVSHLLDIDTAGANRVFESALKKERVLYGYSLAYYASMLVMPLLIGVVVQYLENAVGPGYGISLGFYSFAVVMLFAAFAYRCCFYPKESVKEPGIFLQFMRNLPSMFVRTPLRFWRTTKIVWQNKAIALRFSMVCVEYFIDDALMMVVLPTFALDILNVGITGSAMLLSAMNAGGFLGAMLLVSRAQALQKKYGFYRFLSWLSMAASLAFVPSILFWTTPTLWAAVPAVVLMKFLYEPIRWRMDSLLQTEIANDERAKKEEENIFSLLSICVHVAEGLGGLTFVWVFFASDPGGALYNVLGENAPMKAVTIVLLLFALVNMLGLYWLKGHIYRVVYSDKPVGKEYLQSFEDMIRSEGMPALQKEKLFAKILQRRPTVALLSPPSLNKLAILREGGVEASGDIHLVLDTSWILQEMQSDGTYLLYLEKGIYIDREGDAVLADYRHRRLIHYFANFCTPGKRCVMNGVPLESRLQTPMSSSSKLEHIINEKMLTRYWLNEKGISAPVFLAFLMEQHPFIGSSKGIDDPEQGSTFVAFPPINNPLIRVKLTRQIRYFLEKITCDELVVKPSGARFPPPYKVKFFDKEDVQGMVDHVLDIAMDDLMTVHGAIIIEERLQAPPLYLQFGVVDGSGRFCLYEKEVPLHIMTVEECKVAPLSSKKDWVLHALVSRTPWDKAVTSGILIRVDDWGKPLSPQAVVVTLEDVVAVVREQHGLLTSEEQKWQFERQIEELGNQALLVLSEKAAQMPRSVEEPQQASVDSISMDIMYQLQHGKLVPKIINIGDHDTGRQHLFDELYPERAGEHSRAWIGTMLAKARRDAFRGKVLAIIGAGKHKKPFYFAKAKEYGLEIILIDSPDSWARELVAEFIPVEDMQDPYRAHLAAYRGFKKSIQKYGRIDGITSYCDSTIILTAELARDLKLGYHTVEAARASLNKYKTRRRLKSAGLRVPLFFLVQSLHSLDKALSQVTRMHHATGVSPFPMILRPSKSTGFSLRVDNPEEARLHFDRLCHALGKGDNVEFVFEEFITGNEWDVDLVMQGGRAKHASITDNWILEGYDISVEGDSLPCHSLTLEAQEASINLAIKAVDAIGLGDGVFHVDGKYDPAKGPQILEISPRPAEAYLAEWQLAVWGVDMAEMLFATALNIPIHVYKSELPRANLKGLPVFAGKQGVLTAWEGTEKIYGISGFKEFLPLISIGEFVASDTLVAYIASQGKDADSAAVSLKELQNVLKPVIE